MNRPKSEPKFHKKFKLIRIEYAIFKLKFEKMIVYILKYN